MGKSGRSSKMLTSAKVFLVRFQHYLPHATNYTTLNNMSSNADQVTAKLAALAKLRQQKEEQRRQMEAEAEANRLEEERLEQEVERMRLGEGGGKKT